MLKYQLDSLDGVEESVKSLYVKKGEKYVLAIEGLPEPEDVSGLKAKVEELLEEKKKAAKAAKEADERARQAAEEAARKGGDVESLDKSWRQKLADREAELQAQIKERDGWIHQQTVRETALKLATTLALPGSAEVLLPHIEKRLSMDVRDGKPTAVVLDAAGKPSALSVDELGKEIASTAAFAPLIVASNASGGGANGANGRGGAAAAKANMGGSKEERVAALKQKFPELAS